MKSNRAHTFFAGISVQTLFTLILGVLEMVTFSLFSRLLSKTDFGYFAALMGVMTICISISEAGMGSAVIQKKDAKSNFVSTAYTMSFIMGITGTILVFIFAPLIAKAITSDVLTLPLRIMAFTIILHSLISVGNAQLYRKLNFKRIGINNTISYALSSIIGIYLAYKGYGLYAILTYTVCQSIFTCFLLYLFCVKFPKLSFDKNDAKSITSYGGWLTLGVICNKITMQLDKLVVPRALSVEALGAYNRPAGFTLNIANKIQNIFDTVLFPMLSDIQNDKDKVVGVLYRAVGLLNSISVILACIFFFNADLIIRIFFGEQWLNLVPVMRVVSITVIFYVDSQLVDCFFRSLNLVRLAFYIRFAAIFWTLICLLIGVRFGIMGVAVSMAFANISIIVVKLISLNISVKANLVKLFSKLFLSWKPAILLSVLGVIYISIFSQTIFNDVVFAVIFSLVVFTEFVLCPSLVSQDYIDTIYPYFKKFKFRHLRK